MNDVRCLHRRLRWWTLFFIIGLILSGVTALPLQWELNLLARWMEPWKESGMAQWIFRVQGGLLDTYSRHKFIAYGTDWLGFGHIVIAISFVGALRDPVRNRWLYDFGMIACVMVLPFAFIFGQIRGIPMGWRLIDCCFGVFGFIPLWYCRRWALILETSPGGAWQSARVDLKKMGSTNSGKRSLS